MTPKIQFFALGRSLCNFVNVESVDSLNCLGYNSWEQNNSIKNHLKWVSAETENFLEKKVDL